MVKQAVTFPSKPIKRVEYKSFKGVDATAESLLIDRSRLAVGLNLISDSDGMPEKRLGFRTVKEFEGAINGIYRGEFDGVVHYLVHAGDDIYHFDFDTNISTLKLAGVGDHRSTGFWFGGKQYILTGSEYLVYDGETVKTVSDVAYVPTIYINKAPDGASLSTLEQVNLLSSKWAEEFLSTATSKVYHLAYKEIDDTPVKVEKQVSLGVWEEVPESDYTVDRAEGTVTFDTAPGESPIPGASNIKITASKPFEGYPEKIKNCSICSVFEDDVVFVAGSEKGVDYHSGYNDPTYFPDLGFASIGTDATDIMAYLKLGEQQIIIKEDNNQDATVYVRSKVYDGTDVTFTTSQGAVGVGAISRYASGNLRDDVLFLSRQGVFAVVTSAITLERSLQNRSYYIDPLLTKEQNLEDAVSVVWEGYYIVSVNGRCYVMDGKQNRTYKSQSGGEFIYECYHWDNIHANCFLEVGGLLYFGTKDGKLCQFKTDVLDMRKYSDDGKAIRVVFATKLDDFGSFEMRKTLQKKGTGLVSKPATRSSFQIYLRPNYEPEPIFIRHAYNDILSFDDIDFERFTFNSNNNPRMTFFKKKVKKFTALQLILIDDLPDQAFGMMKVIYNYVETGYDK